MRTPRHRFGRSLCRPSIKTDKFWFQNTVEFRFFEPPREMELGSKNRGFEKSKVASNHTCFAVELFYKIQEGRQQWYVTLVNV